MHVLARSVSADLLADLIAQQAHPDYVYMYPPRQAYRPFDEIQAAQIPELISSSLSRSECLNLYVHVPFCRQICNFCNLYTVSSNGRDLDAYVDAVLMEARRYAGQADRKNISTLYLGGGTPSILSPGQLERLIITMLDLFAKNSSDIPAETALEVDPATVNARKLREIRAAGINRINLGYQSLVQDEVVEIGRRRPAEARLNLLEQALGIGFDNVCVDLIYGLQAQTDESWRESVKQVATLGPQTVCAYALTLRPFTGYSRRGYDGVAGRTLYHRYDIADQILREAGYHRETHVRWVRAGGGYLQKVNHWSLQNILGLGAGARSYLWHVDFRNGYSVRARAAPLRRYLDMVVAGASPITDGYVMTPDERLRKGVMLNLISLDRHWFSVLLGIDPLGAFADEFGVLSELDLCTVLPHRIALTSQGIRYRDLIAQSLFSSTVRTRVERFTYDE